MIVAIWCGNGLSFTVEVSASTPSFLNFKARVEQVEAAVANGDVAKPGFRLEVSALRKRCAELLPCSSQDAPDFGEWSRVVEDLFSAELEIEWQKWSDALAGWRSHVSLLERCPNVNTAQRADFALRLAIPMIGHRIDDHPLEAAMFLDREIGAYLTAATPAALRIWKWSRSSWEDSLYELSEKLPIAQQETSRQRSEKALQAYWNDQRLPWDDRTGSVVLHANILYSMGKGAAAAALLDEWVREGGRDVESNPDWIFQRFFVAAYGEGDASKAVALFRRVEKQVADGALAATDPSFVLMAQCYYRLLPGPTLAWHKIAADTMRERAKKH